MTTEYFGSLVAFFDKKTSLIKDYSEWPGSLVDFISSPDIAHSSKVWAFVNFAPKEKVSAAAADFAMSVLGLFEKAYTDNTPRDAIKAARSYDLRGSGKIANRAFYASSCAARQSHRAASYAAESAGYAAESVESTESAFSAAMHAIYAVQAVNEAKTGVSDFFCAPCNRECEKQVMIMKKYIGA